MSRDPHPKTRTWLFRFALLLAAVAGLSALLFVPVLAEGSSSADTLRPVAVRFEGVIQSQDGLVWRVAGVTVTLNAETEVNEEAGKAEVGARVLVQGTSQPDRSVLARVIKVLKPKVEQSKPIDFAGEIKALPAEGTIGEWTVGDKTVVVTSTTAIAPANVAPAVGDSAHVAGLLQPDGKVLARVIFVRKPVQPEVQFTGPIQSIGDTVWVVRNITVTLSATTVITGASPEVGLIAEVTGLAQPDRSVAATRIVVRPRPEHVATLVGTIVAKSSETLPAVWAIQRSLDAAEVTDESASVASSLPRVISVTVTGSTAIDESKGPAAIGALVQVRATVPVTTSAMEPVVLTATKIVVLRPAPGTQPITFSGPIERIEPTVWRVRGVRVPITDTTQLSGATPLVGLTADVTGTLTAGLGVLAQSIYVHPAQPKPIEFAGTVRALPDGLIGVWQIAVGLDADITASATSTRVVSVTVTTDTVIDDSKGVPAVGAWVNVKALADPTSQSLENATLTATQITVVRPAPTPQPIVFSGPIERIERTVWRVAGRTVQIGDTTVISGAEPKVGRTADVTGTQVPGGPVVASAIIVHEPEPTPVRFVGIVSQLPMPPGLIGTWKIAVGAVKLEVQVTAETDIVGVPRVGRPVAVTGIRLAGGQIVAKKIVVLTAIPE